MALFHVMIVAMGLLLYKSIRKKEEAYRVMLLLRDELKIIAKGRIHMLRCML